MTEDKEQPKTGGKHVFGPGNPGRPKGSPNKFTTLKASFLEAFDKTGGTAGLVRWIKVSRTNRGIFYQMVTKLFPQEIAHSGEIKTNDRLVVRVIHTRAGDKGDGGNGDGQEKKA